MKEEMCIRDSLNSGEGAAQLFVGALTRDMMGGGFLYTNKESISIGLVIGMEQLRSRDDLSLIHI